MTTVRVHLTWVTSATTGVDHAVSDADFASAVRAGQGVFPAACGVSFASAAMCTEPGGVCASCWALLAAEQRSGRHRVQNQAARRSQIERRSAHDRARHVHLLARVWKRAHISHAPVVPSPRTPRAEGSGGATGTARRGRAVDESYPRRSRPRRVPSAPTKRDV